jgi:DNA helicase-2/ATP-dependent DNA helicase PcrA
MKLPLDPEQERAMRAPESRVLVLSGAGSGKTRLLTARAQWLREEQHVPGNAIACITFSKNAAEEMASRLVGDSGFYPDEKTGPQGMWIGTIHALGLRILSSVFRGRTVADKQVSTRFLTRILRELKAPKDLKPGETLKRLERTKAAFQPWPRDIAIYCERYQAELAQHRMWDFTDLLTEAVRLLEERSDVRATWDCRYQHVLVDEVQDTSPVQWRLIRCLVRPSTHLFAVGDLGQSIYAFRGARPEYLLDDLEKLLGQWTTYALTRNYRSVPQVIELANAISAGRRGMVEIAPTRVETTRPAELSALEMLWADSTDQEAQQGLTLIQQALESWALEHGDVAVLCRTNAQIEPWEAACVAAKVPYLVLGGVSFYLRTEVQDVMAWLRIAVAATMADYEQPLTRIYNRPSRYLGKVWYDDVVARGGWGQFLGTRMTFRLAYQQRAADELRTLIQKLYAYAHSGASACDVVRWVVDGPIGYRRWALADGETVQVTSEVDSLVAENLDAVIAGATRFPQLTDYLEFVDLCAVRGARRQLGTGRLVLSTIHRAKGLEWPFVTLAGCVDGKLPHALGMEDEERRLFYVAVTRAGDRLLITGTAEDPSRFVADLVGLPVLAESMEEPDAEAELPAAEGDRDPERVERRTGTGTVIRLVSDTSAAGGGSAFSNARTSGETDGE